METRDRMLGEENPGTIVSRINLALLYSRMGRWEDCEAVSIRNIRIATATLGRDHFYTLSARAVLAGAYVGRGDAAAADRMLPAINEGFRAHYPDGHWRTGRVLVTHGAALTSLERFEEAEARLIEGEALLRNAFSGDNERVQEAVVRLVELYDRWRRPDAKREWESRLAASGS